MDTLTAARAQMEVSLGFHMIFAALGIGLPLLMVLAEGLWLRTGQRHYDELARMWAKATTLTFAVGAVSGTALSFELGLLWPRFMALSGGSLGPAFTLEGYAFFLEAIFLGLYLYGRDRLRPWVHWLTGVAVALSGMISGILVVAANAWMQTPGGYTLENGHLHVTDALAPFHSPAWLHMALHSTLSCYIATGFAVAGVYAWASLQGRATLYHRSALTLSLAMATVAACLQPLSGHLSAQRVATYQPAKLAAMEAHFETSDHVPLLLGGIPHNETGRVPYALKVPSGLSLLVANDPGAVVPGLNETPRDQRPNVLVCHLAFQLMVASGFALIGLGLWYWWARRRGDVSHRRWLLRALVVGAPLGFLALEAGWVVTEVGRQPWIVYGVLRTRDGVTSAAGVPVTFFAFTLLYSLLGVALVSLLRGLAHPADHAPIAEKHAENHPAHV